MLVLSESEGDRIMLFVYHIYYYEKYTLRYVMAEIAIATLLSTSYSYS